MLKSGYTLACRNARFQNVSFSVASLSIDRKCVVSVRFELARVEKMALTSLVQRDAGTACVLNERFGKDFYRKGNSVKRSGAIQWTARL